MQQRMYIALIQQGLSVRRLAGYGAVGGTVTPAALANYLWNVALCESFYPALHCVEVTLRNSIHHAALTSFGDPMWFAMATPVLVDNRNGYPGEEQIVQETMRRLLDGGLIPTADDVVAALDFGFWTALFKSEYDQILWRRRHFMAMAFPNQPSRRNFLGVLAGRFNGIRQFRNRVFHHEPIWKRTDLPQRHADILEALNWMNPAVHLTITTSGVDHFQTIHARGSAYYLALVNQLLASMPP
jgi:hypothetical protein